MPSKKDYEDLIVRVDERTKAIPEIKEQLKQLNGRIADNARKIASTTEIAKATTNLSENTAKNLTRLIIGICLVLLAAILSIGIPMWTN